MTLIQSILMGIVQGLSEFLPVSSSAHLVFTSNFYQVPKNIPITDQSNQEVFLDIMLHLGTLIAVLFFFRKDILDILLNISRKVLHTEINGEILEKIIERGYSKEIGNFDKTPILSLNAYVNGIRYYQKSEPPYVTGCNAYFEVDKSGKSIVSMTWVNPRFERTIGYNEGLLSSRPITEQIVKQKLWFQFRSVHDIQSLIDALDIDKVKQKLLKKTESNKDLDSLFK